MVKLVKIVLSLATVIGIFLKIQDRYHLFDIEIANEGKSIEENQSGDQKDTEQLKNYVEIFNNSEDTLKINVDVADNEAERRAGLSFRKYLGSYEGMLFIFDERVNTSFWMKDMNMPLDLIFIDAEGIIVDIKENNAPCTDTYCPSISSSSAYKYVLEVNANFCQDNNLEEGNKIVMHLDSSI